MGRGYAVVVTDVDGEAARRTAAEIGAAAGLGATRPDGAATAMVHSSGRLLTVGQVAAEAVAPIGTRRVIRALPAWRGGLIRLGPLLPPRRPPASRCSSRSGAG